MQLVDTHTHIYLPEFDNDRDEAVKRALGNNVVKLLLPNIDIHSLEPLLSAEMRYPGICHSMIGLHPTSVKKDYLCQLDKLEEMADQHTFIAVGEIGIDLFWDKTYIKEQITAFKRQVVFGLNKNLPVAIHSRESFPEVFEALKEFEGSGIRGVFHAFTGNLSYAETAIRMGFKLGIGGIVTFKNSGIDSIVKEIGIEHIILETDSPYLAPAPYRRKRNESAYISIINRKIAEIFGITSEEAAARTYSNSIELFNISGYANEK
ncbi:MAG: hydrolase TatD [Odoribacter sp.]|nr:hydrolase TatD [Odoribacter sp.]